MACVNIMASLNISIIKWRIL